MDPFVLGEGEDGEPAMEEAAHLVGLPETALPGEDEVPGSDDHLWMYDDGRIWDLGPADVDSDADGIPDSLTRTGPDGMTVYTDRDHDGRVDTVTRIGADGSYDAHRLDADTGNWVPTDSGRLD
ncbi:DUF6802 family protein [Gordonia sp. DT30]|uniref:DUF6802 family protein n=1 Tax=Gordonia sp. DT30 TaxID=3416546 RepID=UPI003CE8C105